MNPEETLPPCRPDHQHDFADLGTKDNGDKVSRCGTCMTAKFEAADWTIRYEPPEKPADRTSSVRFHDLNSKKKA